MRDVAPPDGRTDYAGVVSRLRASGCVFAEDEADLLCDAGLSPEARDRLVDARVAGAPLEHVLGWADFHGLRVCVDPGVFIPRRRSEFLVDEAIALTRPGDVVVDLCCGTGALGLAIARAVSGVDLHAADLDPLAVRCARRNVELAGGTVVEGDLFDALPQDLCGRIDILVVNAPYVPTEAIRLMPAEARIHENPLALDGGVDGLRTHRRVAAEADAWLSPGGHLLVECGIDQADALADVFRASGLVARPKRDDDGDGVVVIGSARSEP